MWTERNCPAPSPAGYSRPKEEGPECVPWAGKSVFVITGRGLCYKAEGIQVREWYENLVFYSHPHS